jgi:hypothetical protein
MTEAQWYDGLLNLVARQLDLENARLYRHESIVAQ